MISRTRILVLAILTCVVLLCPDMAIGQPHMTPPLDFVATPTAEPDIWLGRLVGKFRFEGMIHALSVGECAPESDDPRFVPGCQLIKGTGDCIKIGTGPGVHCILNVTWQDMSKVDFETGAVIIPPGAFSYLDPAMALFGLDPRTSGINYLLVDNKGLPEGGLGLTTGNRAKFTTECVNVGDCERIVLIEAKPETNLLFMWINLRTKTRHEPITDIVMSLRRVTQTEESEGSASPAAKVQSASATTSP